MWIQGSTSLAKQKQYVMNYASNGSDAEVILQYKNGRRTFNYASA